LDGSVENIISIIASRVFFSKSFSLYKYNSLLE